MGCQSYPDHGLLIGAIVHLLDQIRIDADEAEEAGAMLEATELYKVGRYMSACSRPPHCVDTMGSSWS